MPSMLHDLVAVEIRPDRVEVLFLLEIAHALLHLVHGLDENIIALRLVLCGRVGARQPVQPLIQRTGVLDVAAYGGIGPRLFHIAVEAQMQVHQLR